MDEHDVMEMLRAADYEAGCNSGGATVETWITPGSGPSFGLTIEGTRFIVTVTELPE